MSDTAAPMTSGPSAAGPARLRPAPRRGAGFLFKRGNIWWMQFNKHGTPGGVRVRMSSRSSDRNEAAALLAKYTERGATTRPILVPDLLREYREVLREMAVEPAVPCVYFLVKDSAIVYVGQTVNLPARLQMHVADGKVFDRALYPTVPVDERLTWEAAFIRKLRPALNRSRIPREENAVDANLP